MPCSCYMKYVIEIQEKLNRFYFQSSYHLPQYLFQRQTVSLAKLTAWEHREREREITELWLPPIKTHLAPQLHSSRGVSTGITKMTFSQVGKQRWSLPSVNLNLPVSPFIHTLKQFNLKQKFPKFRNDNMTNLQNNEQYNTNKSRWLQSLLRLFSMNMSQIMLNFTTEAVWKNNIHCVIFHPSWLF